ncbi:polyprenyl synthetase family protein [Massilia sp. B-10]|nr:polyprenyl synthetase family protein [Massilia sp. B-10]
MQGRIEAAIRTHVQGEFPATCFLSGGIDSAIIGALLKRHAGGKPVDAFCATSEHSKIDEGSAARATAAALGLRFHPVQITEADISAVFPKLIWHAEVPTISTEAGALFLLSGQVRQRSKVVLTGEGADEAFGGYLALRQSKLLGPLTAPGLSMLRAAVRPLLMRHYGSDCLLPGDARIDSVRDHLGCFPAQAYEWEFYRAATMPVLAPMYRRMLEQDCQWDGFAFDREAVRGRHWLNRSLYVGYQVMLPNYLLGAHGDRLFAANSIEGRYPFLDRAVIEYAAALPPSLKIRGMREKYILRQAARRWLPQDIAARPKRRFVMPFGTPFTGAGAPPIYRHLLAADTLRAYGYFDPAAVRRVLDAGGAAWPARRAQLSRSSRPRHRAHAGGQHAAVALHVHRQQRRAGGPSDSFAPRPFSHNMTTQPTDTAAMPDRLDQVRVAIDQELARIIDHLAGRGPEHGHPLIGRVYRWMRHYLANDGKRMHGIAVVLAHRACGGKLDQAILPVAAAMQLYHHHTLVHDDIYDEDHTRRGWPTAHAAFIAGSRSRPGRTDPSTVFAGKGMRRGVITAFAYGKICRAVA